MSARATHIRELLSKSIAFYANAPKGKEEPRFMMMLAALLVMPDAKLCLAFDDLPSNVIEELKTHLDAHDKLRCEVTEN